MSFLGAMYNGVAGLNVMSHRLNALSQNLVNIQTVGYKEREVNFRDMVGKAGQPLGHNIYVDKRDKIAPEKNGSILQGTSASDMAIAGRGFFVVRGNPNDATTQTYTRDGQFRFDNNGNLVNKNGQTLMAFPMTDGIAAKNLQPFQLTLNEVVSAAPTTFVRTRLNLPQGADPITLPATFDDPIETATNEQAIGATGLNVFDTNGTSHGIEARFFKTGTNTWALELATTQGAFVSPPSTTNRTEVSQPITLEFDRNGVLASPTANPTITVAWESVANADGVVQPAVTNSFELDVQKLGQLDGEFVVFNKSSDGHTAGRFVGISIDEDGVASALSNNGFNEQRFQVPLATFRANEGLEEISGNLFRESPASGAPSIDIARTDGRGRFIGGALEASNVNMGEQFVKVIETQKAFGFNTSVIKAVDQLLTTTIALKR